MVEPLSEMSKSAAPQRFREKAKKIKSTTSFLIASCLSLAPPSPPSASSALSCLATFTKLADGGAPSERWRSSPMSRLSHQLASMLLEFRCSLPGGSRNVKMIE